MEAASVTAAVRSPRAGRTPARRVAMLEPPVRDGPRRKAAGVLSNGGSMRSTSQASRLRPLPGSRDRVPPVLLDKLLLSSGSDIRLGGWLGARIDADSARRLLEADENAMLAGFRKRPGAQAWIGEHVGKFLHAASLATRNRSLPALAEKRDRVGRALIACQEPDGYLGTYVAGKRFGLYPEADWDVWVHKYCLLGLLAWHESTGNPDALRACVRIGDLLMRVFPPGGKSLASAGTHVGMAATSVLEPMVLLHRRTGNSAYLDFARRIVVDWDRPGGPSILTSLRNGKGVEGTANAKAYEMLSNLVGLCELARSTGDRNLLIPVNTAWEDIVAHHRYITGSLSRQEHFGPDHDLPNQTTANVGETCVTVTWIQLNTQLLRLTGDPKFAAEIERSLWNHLAAAQRPDGAQWCYYTALEGTKPYGPGINCCVSSGPRAMALAPYVASMVGTDGTPVILLPESMTVGYRNNGKAGQLLHVVAVRNGRFSVRLQVKGTSPQGNRVRWRVPQWLSGRIPGERDGWTVWTLPSVGAPPRTLVDVPIGIVREVGSHGNVGSHAYRLGPWILAAQGNENEPSPWKMRLRHLEAVSTGTSRATIAMEQRNGGARTVSLLPFAEAGASGERYAVWLRGPGEAWPPAPATVIDAEEDRSHPGNVQGSIVDGNPRSFVVTFDGSRQRSAWFSINLFEPITISKVVYCHGHAFVDGGWYVGAPVVEARLRPGGPWVRLGTLDTYPATTSASPAGLMDGQAFTLVLERPTEVTAVRVIGTPASGNQNFLSFASCGELGVVP